MLPRIRRPIGPDGRRRGVTLVEMLVVVALVVLMMTILVQIFQSATGAMSISRTTAEMDVTLRQIESIIRSDLSGVTAKMTPPNDPKDQRGYFEYNENAPADAQGEDIDDTLGMTTKAPDGTVFTGRQMIAQPNKTSGPSATLAPITSQVAEVIYFVRNGNLYRRVFLVVPDREKSILPGSVSNGFYTNLFGQQLLVSWQGLNDISCRAVFDPTFGGTGGMRPKPNTLGDLTNRENRAFRPRFANDYLTPPVAPATSATINPDGIVDDYNGDGLPDFYPTIYTSGGNNSYTDAQGVAGSAPNIQTLNLATFSSGAGRPAGSNYDVYAFPFIYPWMYTAPAGYTGPNRIGTALGWTHCLAPGQITITEPDGTTSTTYALNHSPLESGDTSSPASANVLGVAAPAANQTWWGYPTWRETMTGYQAASSGSGSANPGWTDAMTSVNSTANSLQQPLGLRPIAPTAAPGTANINLLPPIATMATPRPFTDTSAGSSSFIANPATTANPDNPRHVWEDDLLLTGVRSFDVKAYDLNAPLYNIPQNFKNYPDFPPFAAGYQDLGYGSQYYERTGLTTNGTGIVNYVQGPNGPVTAGTTPGPLNPIVITNPALAAAPWQSDGAEPVGFGHEGRIPPLPSDYRIHPRRPLLATAAGGFVPNNIGDPSAGVIRLTRVWDSWSTDYTNAPDTDIFLNNYSPYSPAIYPSFPPPYPTALRGIQIQIRMTDARGERTKSITIRHDFTDKLN